ncbi:hypothetical protein M513_00831, partial [Trichuris suis]
GGTSFRNNLLCLHRQLERGPALQRIQHEECSWYQFNLH